MAGTTTGRMGEEAGRMSERMGERAERMGTQAERMGHRFFGHRTERLAEQAREQAMRAGDKLRHAGSHMRENLETARHRGQSFVSRRPGMVVGGAVIAGFVGFRLMKAASRRRREQHRSI